MKQLDEGGKTTRGDNMAAVSVPSASPGRPKRRREVTKRYEGPDDDSDIRKVST